MSRNVGAVATTLASPLRRLAPSPSRRKQRSRAKVVVDVEPPHPETFLTQENFLASLGLVTHEVYRRKQAESVKTERRRRTTTTKPNPKYSSSEYENSNDIGVI